MNSPISENGDAVGTNPYPEKAGGTNSKKPLSVGTNPFPGSSANTPLIKDPAENSKNHISKGTNQQPIEQLSENSSIEHEINPVNTESKVIDELDGEPELSKISVSILYISLSYIFGRFQDIF